MRLPLRDLTISLICFLILTFSLAAQLKQEALPATSILGFYPPHAAAERALESVFQSIPSREKAREWHRTFTAEPHPAASDRNNRRDGKTSRFAATMFCTRARAASPLK